MSTPATSISQAKKVLARNGKRRPTFASVFCVVLVSACITESPLAPTPENGDITIPESAPLALPNRVLGASSDSDDPAPCATAIGVVGQVLVIPMIEVDGSPASPYRIKAETANASYAYNLKPVHPVNCTIVSAAPATGGGLVTFGFTYFQDRAPPSPGCVEASHVALTQFDAPLQSQLLAPHLKAAIWSALDTTPIPLATTGERCPLWSPMPAPYWP